MQILFLFILGLFVGSFLNVVALRFRRENFLTTRSYCPKCERVLKWWELIPVFGFIFLRARCSNCEGRISLRYPLVELLTGMVFALLQNWFFILIFSIYIVIALYYLEHKIIPNELVYVSIFFSLIFQSIVSSFTLLDWLTGPILFIFFASFWYFSKGRAMGFGDAKLGLSVGLLLGFAKGLSAIVLAFWIGAFVSIVMMFWGRVGFITRAKKLTMKSEIPFAPFIIIGAFVSLIFNLDVLSVSLL